MLLSLSHKERFAEIGQQVTDTYREGDREERRNWAVLTLTSLLVGTCYSRKVCWKATNAISHYQQEGDEDLDSRLQEKQRQASQVNARRVSGKPQAHQAATGEAVSGWKSCAGDY